MPGPRLEHGGGRAGRGLPGDHAPILPHRQPAPAPVTTCPWATRWRRESSLTIVGNVSIMSSYSQPGTVLSDVHVPLDHAEPEGEQIELFARLERAAPATAASRLAGAKTDSAARPTPCERL